jgi:hypothetical protein
MVRIEQRGVRHLLTCFEMQLMFQRRSANVYEKKRESGTEQGVSVCLRWSNDGGGNAEQDTYHALGTLFVHDSMAAFPASDGLARPNFVGRCAICADILHDRIAAGKAAHSSGCGCAGGCAARAGWTCLVRHPQLRCPLQDRPACPIQPIRAVDRRSTAERRDTG